MDKYEYRIRAEEINALIERKQFAEAVKIADTIDWSRVKSVMMLCKVSELYKYVRRFEDAKEILLLAYDRQPGGRKIVYSLCELCIKLEETVQAVEYYKEFVQVAPTDTRRFILQYRLYEAQDVSLEERIAVLEEYKKRDYREKWAYELAYLYHRIGLATRCVEECDELILWFGEGKYVNMAMELKMLHQPLSPSQQEKYNRRFMPEEPAAPEAGPQPEEHALPIEIKSVDVTKAKTAEIIPGAIKRSLENADTVEVPNVKEVIKTKEPVQPTVSVSEEEESIRETEDEDRQPEQKEMTVLQQPEQEEEDLSDRPHHPGEILEELSKEPDQQTQPNLQTPQAEEIPVNEPDFDIQIKTVDVGEYNTINLQKELADNLSKMFAQEDMEAADATMALPIETIIGTTTANGKVIDSITDDAIKDALLAPLLEEDKTQITEEDLLAAVEQERREKEEAARQEAERLEIARAEAERLAAERAEAERLAAEKAEAERLAVEKAEAERLAAEKAEAERLAAEKAEAERLAAERAEAERLAAEKAEAERLAAEKAEAEKAAPVTAGAIMAAEIAHAVKTGNTESLNIGTPRLDIGNLSANGRNGENADIADEQITGQLSLLDIMNEWEETKRANEEKRIAEMRDKVMKQTGPMFNNFDEVARASVATDLDLINPAVDVFKANNDDIRRKDQVYTENDVSDLNETFYTDEEKESDIRVPDASDPAKAEEDSAASGPKRILNTEEINGLEEKLIETLVRTEQQQKEEAAVPSFVPDIDFENPDPKTEAEDTQAKQERVIISEEVETKGVSVLASMINTKQQADSEPEQPISPEIETEQSAAEEETQQTQTEEAAWEETQQAQTEEAAWEETQQAQTEEAAWEEIQQAEGEKAAREDTQQAEPEKAAWEEIQADPEPEQQIKAEIPVAHSAAEAVAQQAALKKAAQEAAEARAGEKEKQKETPIPLAHSAAEAVMQQAAQRKAAEKDTHRTLGQKQADTRQNPVSADEPEARTLTREEKELFGSIAPLRNLQEKLAAALDNLSLTPTAGNAVVTGDHGVDTMQIAQNVVKYMQDTHPQFTGEAVMLTGEELAAKDIASILMQAQNGALIIQNAGEIEPDMEGSLIEQLQNFRYDNVLVILEDTREDIERLMLTYEQLGQMFPARIDVEVLDNDGLVQYAKAYANSREYAIDEMGTLAVYTRISDMQTNEHAVTIKEVREMVDQAIDRAEKKNVRHFVDVLIGKRFDDEDMIILREKDFSIE